MFGDRPGRRCIGFAVPKRLISGKKEGAACCVHRAVSVVRGRRPGWAIAWDAEKEQGGGHEELVGGK
jgi:hypothetical protein